MKTEVEWVPGLALLGLLGLLVGCGSGEAPRPKTTPLGETAATDAGEARGADGSAQAPANRPPVIRRIDLKPSRPLAGSRVAASVDAFDPDGDRIELSYAWDVDGERAGDDGSALLLGDVAKGSVVQVTVVARDGESQSAAETGTARVGNRPPTMLGVVIEPLDEVRADRNVSANPRAQDPDGDPIEYHYRWAVNGESVGDDGPVLDARFFERGDRIQLTVEAHDGEESSSPLRSDPFPVVNSPPRITSAPGAFDPDGTFRYAIVAEDPDGDRSLRYEIRQGPAGMEVDVVSGELTWTPSPDQAGSHPVAIAVGDRKGGTATQSFDIRVEFEAASPPASQGP